MKTLLATALLLTGLAAAPVASAAPEIVTHECSSILGATQCYLQDLFGVACIPEPPVVGPAQCFLDNAVESTLTYVDRLCGVAFRVCTAG